MAAIQCPGCKAHISVPGLIDCPRCKTFLNPPFLKAIEKAPAAAAVPGVDAKTIFSLVIVTAIVLLGALILYRVAVPSEEKVQARKISAALVTCQQRIAGLADYGGAETPPYVKNFGKGDEFYFAWSTGSFHFKNDFGAQVPMSASCIGEVSSGQIKQLTLNGKEIL